MAFALTISHLKDMMNLPGCPTCRFSHNAAEHSVASFLWENVNDPVIGEGINASFGFCPDHTRLLVAKELMESGTVLGVNIIYERLSHMVANELQSLVPDQGSPSRLTPTSSPQSISKDEGELKAIAQPISKDGKAANPLNQLGRLLRRIGIGGEGKTPMQILTPTRQCPICIASEKAAQNALEALYEEIERGREDLRMAYLASDGLCLAHLRQATSAFRHRYPTANRLILNDTASRLKSLAAAMKGYIRKRNWEYRSEKMTPEEGEAWRKALTFFTGLPGGSFTHQIEKF